MATTVVQNSNQSIRLNGSLSNSRTSNGTLYTAPSNAYAIVSFRIAWAFGSGVITISCANVNWFSINSAVDVSSTSSFYVGPGQSVSVNFGMNGTAYIQGVEFINSLNGA